MLRIYSFCCSKIGMGVVRRASLPPIRAKVFT